MMAFSRTSAVQPRVLDLNERLREISKLLRPVLGDDIEILMVPRSPSAVVEVEALADHESRRREDLVEWHGWHAFRRGLRSNVNDLGALDLTIQKILRHSNVTTTQKSYVYHREHQVTAAMGQLAAGIEAESRKAEAERLAANQTAETVN
jgi:integrase